MAKAVLDYLTICAEVLTQRFRLRSVPSIDEIGGPVEGLTCIVTGPTSGIGREIAAALSRRGAHVVLACRSLSKGAALKRELIEEAEKGRDDDASRRSNGDTSSSTPSSSSSLVVTTAPPSLEVRELDVADLESVRSFVRSWGDRPLHVLVNNAGVFNMGTATRETTRRDGLESHMATNHLGHFLLAVLLLPRLAEGARSPAAAAAAAKASCSSPGDGRGGKRAKDGSPSFFPSRVVSVSSALHSFADGRALSADPQLFVRGYSPTAAYANSKLAQVMFTAELRRRVAGAVGGGGGGLGGGGALVEGILSGCGIGSSGSGNAAGASGRSSAVASPPSNSDRRQVSKPSTTPPPALAPPPIVGVAVHPGEVLTDVVRSLPAFVVALYRRMMSTLLLTPQEGARSAVFAATAMATAGGVGEGASDGSAYDLLSFASDPSQCYLFPDCRPRPPSPDVLDPVLGRWLWGWSSAKVGLGATS